MKKMISKPNSVLSFIFSFLSLAVLLDYLLWPRTIKASETIEPDIPVKIIAGIAMLLLSILLRKKAHEKENPNGWIKTSGFIITTIALIFVASLTFYIYIELTK